MEMESWNKLCRALSEEISSDLLETPFEREVIYALDSILGWDRWDNVLPQVPIYIGSKGSKPHSVDIVVKDNITGKNLFPIEVKKPNDSLEGHEKQLGDYMLYLRLNVGVLIGEKIKIYFDRGDRLILIDDIEFKRDSQKGFSFVKNFHKENYSEENIQKYIQEKLKEKEEIKIVKKLKKELLSQSYNDKIISFLKSNFDYQYSENVIKKVFEELRVKVESASKKVEEVSFKNNKKTFLDPNETNREGKGVNTHIRNSFKNLDKNCITNEELNNLQNSAYSKKTFKNGHPFLVKKENIKSEKDKKRYWNDPFEIRGEIYFACSQWSSSVFIKKENKTQGEIRKEKFDIWLNKMKNQ